MFDVGRFFFRPFAVLFSPPPPSTLVGGSILLPFILPPSSFILLPFLLLSFPAFTQEPPPPAPKLVCTQPEFNFNSAPASQTLHHRFTIRNEGSAPLLITKLFSCCGADLAISTNSIPPAAAAVLSLSLPLAGRSGPLHKSLYVHSNDPATPILQLRVTGDVQKK